MISLEDPDPQVTGAEGVSDLPDLVTSIRRDWFERWHVKSALLLRQIGAVNNAGYQFLGAGKSEVAREVLALNTRLFPESANTWDSLGEAYMTLGNGEEAIRNYEKSLELNAGNSNATAMIARIREE